MDANIGMVGLGVMGRNLALNMGDHGYVVAGLDLSAETVDTFVADNPPEVFGSRGGRVIGAKSPEELVGLLERPRKIVLLVPAGGPTDGAIDSLWPLLEPGDVIVDGGNTHWPDTERREKALAEHGIHFLGSGVSGGEVGARFGPSLMPGGPRDAWEVIKPIWMDIAAKVGSDGKPIEGATPGNPVDAPDAEPCTAYIGPGGSGHFVKMVHNGIEYADMQLIAEAFDLLRTVMHLPIAEIGEIFDGWCRTDLDSYLVEISADILKQKDPSTGRPFVEIVLDAAGQKGTGRWTGIVALDQGAPAPTIAEAVFARVISSMRDERERASGVLPGPSEPFDLIAHDDTKFVGRVRHALYCAKVCVYAQGFALIDLVSKKEGWGIDPASLARIWRGGCIIRAHLLEEFARAFARDQDLPNLLLDRHVADRVIERSDDWRRCVAIGAQRGVPMPAMSSALAFFDGYRSKRLPASLIQAQRDYFGAHTYERVDRPRGEFFHLDWPSVDRVETRRK